MAIKTIEMDLEYMNLIQNPPQTPQDMYSQAASNDRITCDTWRRPWIDQKHQNSKKYGPLGQKTIAPLFNKYKNQPCIVVGSGPSLAKNVHLLKNHVVKDVDGKDRELSWDEIGIPVISCLHNFHYLVDHGAHVDYFVTLDAGPVVTEEVWEGGLHEPDYYWEKTKDYTLLAYVSTHPTLLEKWQGKVMFFASPIPALDIYDEMQKDDPVYTLISSGGNVLGACVYIAKIMGCNPVIFTGADFCFSYTKQFHPWKSKYDGKLGHAFRAIDVYGNKVLTWQSYFNFAQWFNWLCMTIPGIYVNCTEGGIMGCSQDGILMQTNPMDLSRALKMYSFNFDIAKQCQKPTEPDNIILY